MKSTRTPFWSFVSMDWMWNRCSRTPRGLLKNRYQPWIPLPRTHGRALLQVKESQICNWSQTWSRYWSEYLLTPHSLLLNATSSVTISHSSQTLRKIPQRLSIKWRFPNRHQASSMMSVLSSTRGKRYMEYSNRGKTSSPFHRKRWMSVSPTSNPFQSAQPGNTPRSLPSCSLHTTLRFVFCKPMGLYQAYWLLAKNSMFFVGYLPISTPRSRL